MEALNEVHTHCMGIIHIKLNEEDLRTAVKDDHVMIEKGDDNQTRVITPSVTKTLLQRLGLKLLGVKDLSVPDTFSPDRVIETYGKIPLRYLTLVDKVCCQEKK